MSIKRDFAEKVAALVHRYPLVDGSQHYFPHPDIGTREWEQALKMRVPMHVLRSLLLETRTEHGKETKLLADGLPRPLDVLMMLKGMHSSSDRSRDGVVDVTYDALSFYIKTGRDPYMFWGVSQEWER